MMSAWGRMCKILGQSFVQYLPVVVEPLLKVASIQPEITFIDCEWVGWTCAGMVHVQTILVYAHV